MTDNLTIRAKFTIKIIGIILFVISFSSIFYIVYESVTHYTFNLKEPEYFLNFIRLFTKYQGVYSATFIVIATYYALNQYIENFKSNNTAIIQFQTQLKDIDDRIEKEKIELTMNQCKYFYDDIQSTIKAMYRSFDGILQIDHIAWTINDFTEEDLHRQDQKWHQQFDSIPDEIRDKIVLSMSKLEMFSTYFMDGNADLEIGFKTVGKAFCRQVLYIYPLISIWRSKKRVYDDNFYNKTIELYIKWSNQIEKIRIK